MDEKTCKDCQHFRQHYSLDKRGLFRLYCGHCTLPGVKRKRPDSRACGQFAPGADDTGAFATKEYLSKELLRYVLRLELLPEIEEFAASEKP